MCLGRVICRAENEKTAIKMQTDDLKAAHDHLIGEKARGKEREKIAFVVSLHAGNFLLLSKNIRTYIMV